MAQCDHSVGTSAMAVGVLAGVGTWAFDQSWGLNWRSAAVAGLLVAPWVAIFCLVLLRQRWLLVGLYLAASAALLLLMNQNSGPLAAGLP